MEASYKVIIVSKTLLDESVPEHNERTDLEGCYRVSIVRFAIRRSLATVSMQVRSDFENVI
jgi:hypothetical protein